MTSDPTPAAEATSSGSRRGGYLPVLPDGWAYTVRMLSDDGASDITIVPHDDTAFLVHVSSSAGRKSLTRGTLAEAIRSGVDASKVLDRLARTEAEYAAARDAALASIGGDEDDVVDATIIEPDGEPDLPPDTDEGADTSKATS